ncbi:3-deoxy-7-phosphoheptulonate synthase, partial [Sphaerisporangium sp. TRM90804]|nr:3-deoxy-7-phosphoheptulonate synthase [Sphaerisporangium sp. TRM90804]
VLPLTRAAIAVGADGVIIDVHPQPEIALCDGPQALVEDDLHELARSIRHLAEFSGRTPATRRELVAG